MEIYKGASAFAGIAIGKIRFYRKGEYQIRQHQADDVKKELKNFGGPSACDADFEGRV